MRADGNPVHTQVHLLPVFDFGSVPEREDVRRDVNYEELIGYGPASDAQQV